jgi:hypothetical protein
MSLGRGVLRRRFRDCSEPNRICLRRGAASMAWRHPFDGKLSPDGMVGAPFLRRLNTGSLAMTEHKFKIGQLVYFHPRKGPGLPLFAPEGPYKVLKRLSAAAGEFQYVIRCTNASHDCVARESELRGA